MDFNQDRVLLETLNFTAPLEKPTKDKLLKGLKLTQKSGRLSAHGSVNIHNQQSNLAIEIDHLPVAQQEDRWIVVSGTSLVGFSDNVLDVTGKIMTDIGFIKQPEAGTPNLAEDIIITGKTDSEPESQVFKINLMQHWIWESGSFCVLQDWRGGWLDSCVCTVNRDDYSMQWELLQLVTPILGHTVKTCSSGVEL